MLAGIYQKEKKIDDALRTNRWILDQHPNSKWIPGALRNIAQLHDQRGNRSGAQQARQDLLEKHPASAVTAEVWLPVAKEAFDSGDFRRANEIFTSVQAPKSEEMRTLADLSSVLAQSGSGPRALLVAAGGLMDTNRIEQATTVLEYWKKQFPKAQEQLEADTRLGWCYYLQARGDTKELLEKAEKLWRNVVAAGPVDDRWVRDAHWHLVQLQSGPKSNWKEAVKLCAEIGKVAPSGSVHQEQALLAGAWLLYVHKEYEAAELAFAELEKALPETANLPPVRKYREEIALALQRK